MNYLVTGGAGFIGSNFLEYMTSKYPDDTFVCLDLLTYAGKIENLYPRAFFQYNFKFVRGDINDRELVNNLFEKYHFDYVINFAAESHVDNSIISSSKFIQTNIAGTENLLSACLKYGVKRYHQVSTDEVYGDLPLNNIDLKFKEDSLIKPSNPYAASKASADMLTLAYYRTYGLPVTISRCCNNYGIRQYPEKLIPVVIKKTLNDESIPVYGNGKNMREWISVNDHCRAIDLIIHNGIDGQVYNVGSGVVLDNITIVKNILYYLNKDESLITYVDDRKGHDLRYTLDYSKIQNELGYENKDEFNKTLKKTIDWYKEDHSKIRNELEYKDKSKFTKSLKRTLE